MNEILGLRERKKRETRRALRTTATRMFAERGFDAVTVAEVAAEVGVSAKTVFNYYATKEDLVLSGRDELDSNLAAAYRAGAAGEALLEVMRHHAVALTRRLFEVPVAERAALRQVFASAPSVHARWLAHRRDQEGELTEALLGGLGGDDADHRDTAAFLARVISAAVDVAYTDLTAWPGDAPRGLDAALAAVHQAFDLLEGGVQMKVPAG